MITGASRGLGMAIAEALAPTHTLFLAGRPTAELDAVAERLGAVQLHEHFLHLLAYGTTPDAVYYVMRLGGGSLLQLRRSTVGGVLGARATLVLAVRMTRALAALHRCAFWL